MTRPREMTPHSSSSPSSPDGDKTVVLLVENMAPPQTRETLDGQVGGWTIVLKALQDYAAR